MRQMFSNSNSFAGVTAADLALARISMWFPVVVWQPGPGKRQ